MKINYVGSSIWNEQYEFVEYRNVKLGLVKVFKKYVENDTIKHWKILNRPINKTYASRRLIGSENVLSEFQAFEMIENTHYEDSGCYLLR